MIGYLDKVITRLLHLIQGGGESLQSIKDDLATGLDLARSPQSGSLLMDGNEQTIYIETDTLPFVMNQAHLDLTTMAAGDTIRARVYVTLVSGGAYVKISDDALNTFVDAQDPAGKVLDEVYGVYGIKITLQQTVAGTLRTIPYEVYDAKRGV